MGRRTSQDKGMMSSGTNFLAAEGKQENLGVYKVVSQNGCGKMPVF